MDEEARAHRKRELEERRKRLESLKAQNAIRSKENAERLRREKANKDEADRKLIQNIIKEVPIHNENIQNVDVPVKDDSKSCLPTPVCLVLEMQAGLAEVSIQATPKESYTQSTQTETSEDDGIESMDSLISSKSPMVSPTSSKDGMASPSRNGGGISPRSRTTPLSRESINQGKSCLTYEEPSEVSEKLSETEVVELLNSEDLISFVSAKSSILERALGEALIFDPTQDFIRDSISDGVQAAGVQSDEPSIELKKSSFDHTKSHIKVTAVLDGASHHGKAWSIAIPFLPFLSHDVFHIAVIL